jgi:hypothetical protein
MLSPRDPAVKRFVGEIRAEWDATPVWLPGTAIRVGDVGTLDGGFAWHPKGSISQYGVRPKTRTSPVSMPMQHISSQGVTIKAALNASAPGTISMKAGFSAHFSEAGAVVFRADEVSDSQLMNFEAVQAAIARAAAQGLWRPNMLFVTHVVDASNGIVLVSKLKGGGLGVTFSGTAIAGSAKGGISVSGDAENLTQFRIESQTAVLYKAERLRPDLRIRASGKGIPSEAKRIAVMEEVDSQQVWGVVGPLSGAIAQTQPRYLFERAL